MVLVEGFLNIDYEIVFQVFLATALGAVIGFERELKHRPAGLRTHMLVCLGAAIFTIVSGFFGGTSDPSRIASGIVTGIGFLGAGSIIALRGHIQGITSAATLWVVAAVGLAVGLGEYSLAVISSVLIFGILRIKSVEDKYIHSSEKKSKDGL